MRYRREIQVATKADDTFAYLADFANTAEWDPGVAEARRLDAGAHGRRQPIRGDRAPPGPEAALRVRRHRVRRGVAYRAAGGGRQGAFGRRDHRRSKRKRDAHHLRGRSPAKGVYRVAEPFLRSTFRQMGDDALDGLAARLAETAR